MKETIDIEEYAGTILKALRKGALLTTKADGKVNTMTVSWGELGIDWAKPVFTVYVREHRFTHEQLERNGEFTISIPMGSFNRRILGICGTQSGRDTDKIAAAGLHLEEPSRTSVPGVRELPLTLECRVLYRQDQGLGRLDPELKEKFYLQDVDGSHHDRNRDFHTAYTGEIVAAYVIKGE